MPDYTKQVWFNGPDGQTPLDADRLNHMEDGIAAASVDEILVLEPGESVPVGTPAGTFVVRKSVDPFAIAPVENQPVITFAPYDVWSDTSTIPGSPGRFREKRVGAAETAAGAGQSSAGDLDLTGSSHYRYHGFPSAPDFASNSTRSVATTVKPGGNSQFANWLLGLGFTTSSPSMRIALNPVATNGDLGFITVNGQPISARATIFTASAGNPTEAILTFPDSRSRTIVIEGLNQNQGRFGGITVENGYTITKPTKVIKRRIAFIGDSFVNGNGVGVDSASETETFIWRLAKLMGADEIIQAGVGGTGFVNGGGDGSPGLYSNRVAPVLAMAPDVLFISGGYNDNTTGLASAIGSVLSATASVPERYLVYTGSDASVGAIYASSAAAAGVPFIAPDIASLPKLVDGVHPTWAGHQTLADEIYADIN
jgi:lysophospholipase L1-like esterase